TGQRYKEYDLVPEASAELYLQLDQELQNSVINFLAKAPRHLIAVCTVHYKTLKEDSVRKQYLEGFAKRSVEELSHRLWIEIVGAPTVLIDYEIQPIMSELEEISSHIILRTSLEKPSTANISQFGFQGISVDVEALQGISANAFKSKMRTWCSEANKKTLRTIVRGIENPEWFCMTRESGISCIMSAHLLELLDG
ncbi:MAG: hypothetical protein K0R10_1286, partial [Alphaproteobacteria bacterium]|nr:hypothetical protein [Alphaproteobacteria bacterium]